MSKKLQDCCSFQEGYVNPSQKDRSFFGGDIKWLRSMDLNNSHIYDTSQHLTNKGFLSAGKSAFMFPKHSIAISKSGTIGELGILEEEMCGNRAVIDIMVDENKADLMYVFYTLKYKKAEIIAKSVGSIQKNLYISELEKISLNHDNIEEQAKISNVLQLIDDKIEINNKINAELESMAKTIYDYWFLQFEFPNEEGKPYKSSGGKMVWNEELKREIPEGWEVLELKEIFSFEKGKIPNELSDVKSEVCNREYITIDVANGGIPQYCESEKMVSCNGETIMVMDGAASGDVYVGNKGILGSTFAKLAPVKSNISNNFIYWILKSNSENYKKANTGSTVPHANRKYIEAMKIALPNNIHIFSDVFDNIQNKINHNKKENQELASLREFLLPMLMNGQVGFKDGE